MEIVADMSYSQHCIQTNVVHWTVSILYFYWNMGPILGVGITLFNTKVKDSGEQVEVIGRGDNDISRSLSLKSIIQGL